MKTGQFLLAILLSVALSTAAAFYIGGAKKEKASQPAVKETRLEQIKRTGVLRCGYVNWPPFTQKDPNTGKLSGMSYEIVEEIGRQLKLKVEWVSEVSTGSMLSDINLNRFDMICSPFAITPGRAREANFTMPFSYMPVYMYVSQRRFAL